MSEFKTNFACPPERIQQIREANHATFNEMATLLGVTATEVDQMETGDKPVTRDVLDKLAMLTGYEAWAIAQSPTFDPAHHGQLKLRVVSKTQRAILTMFERLTAEQQDDIMYRINTYLAENKRGV